MALKENAKKYILKTLKDYPKAKKAWEFIHNHNEIKMNWDMADYIMIEKMKYNDHGRTHAYIVASNALKLFKLIQKLKIKTDLIKDHGGNIDDVATILLVSALFHDIGNQVDRTHHYMFGNMIANNYLDEILEFSHGKSSKAKRVILKSFIYHAIAAHDLDCQPLTLEASLCSIADAFDLTEGRALNAFNMDAFSMHTFSALSIKTIDYNLNKKKKIQIDLEMADYAGIFQLENLLLPKIMASNIRDLFEFKISILPRVKKQIHKIEYKKGDFHFI